MKSQALPTALSARFRSPTISAVAEPVAISVTIGAALAPRDGDTPESLLWCGDAALYIAKKAGKGVYRRYSERRSS